MEMVAVRRSDEGVEKYNKVNISSYEPRICGLATYCKNKRTHAPGSFNSLDDYVIAIDNSGRKYDSKDVRCVIDQNDGYSWKNAAYYISNQAINRSDGGKIKTVVDLNHEYGLGGATWDEDDHYSLLIGELKKTNAYKAGLLRIVMTKHTILSSPSEKIRKMEYRHLAECDAVTVLSAVGRKLLSDRHGKYANKIFYVDHGAQERDSDAEIAEARAIRGADENLIDIISPGLMGPNKGTVAAIEGYIRAAKYLERKRPWVRTRFNIQGEAHGDFVGNMAKGELKPGFVKFADDVRRLIQASGLGLNKEDPFSVAGMRPIEEILKNGAGRKHGIAVSYGFLEDRDYFLQIASHWLANYGGYTNPEQITSGQVAAAMSQGTPILASKFSHAKELILPGANEIKDLEARITDGGIFVPEGVVIGANGVLVDCNRDRKSMKQIAAAIQMFASSRELRNRLKKGAKMRGEMLYWRETKKGEDEAYQFALKN